MTSLYTNRCSPAARVTFRFFYISGRHDIKTACKPQEVWYNRKKRRSVCQAAHTGFAFQKNDNRRSRTSVCHTAANMRRGKKATATSGDRVFHRTLYDGASPVLFISYNTVLWHTSRFLRLFFRILTFSRMVSVLKNRMEFHKAIRQPSFFLLQLRHGIEQTPVRLWGFGFKFIV